MSVTSESLELENVLFVRFHGVLDIAALPEFSNRLRTLRSSLATTWVVILSDVRRLSSRCLVALVGEHKRIREKGGRLVVVPPVDLVKDWHLIQQQLARASVTIEKADTERAAAALFRLPQAIPMLDNARAEATAKENPASREDPEADRAARVSLLKEVHDQLTEAVSKMFFGDKGEEAPSGGASAAEMASSPSAPAASPGTDETNASSSPGLLREVVDGMVFWMRRLFRRQ